MSVLVVGTVAFDDIETPFGRAERVIGGAETYIKEQIYRKLIDEFGYSDKLKLPSDWSKIPEYNLEDE